MENYASIPCFQLPGWINTNSSGKWPKPVTRFQTGGEKYASLGNFFQLQGIFAPFFSARLSRPRTSENAISNAEKTKCSIKPWSKNDLKWLPNHNHLPKPSGFAPDFCMCFFCLSVAFLRSHGSFRNLCFNKTLEIFAKKGNGKTHSTDNIVFCFFVM